MSNKVWIKKNWKWLLLLWFNFTTTTMSVAFSWISSWGVGLILYLSAIVSVALLMMWKDVPGGDHAKALIQITDEAIYEDDNGYCCCKYCGSENQNLLSAEYKFDIRFHYPSCIVTIARQSVDPQAIKFAPEEYFHYQSYEGDYHDQEIQDDMGANG